MPCFSFSQMLSFFFFFRQTYAEDGSDAGYLL